MRQFITFSPIGYIANDFNEGGDVAKAKQSVSQLIIDPKYEAEMRGIMECDYIDVIYELDRSKYSPHQIGGKAIHNRRRGAFASRSPVRPNPIGITTVGVLGIQQDELNRILVSGLDAYDRSLILDIKCCDTSLFADSTDNSPLYQSTIQRTPRIDIHRLIMENREDALLTRAGQMHGHYCPGLAMGVMAAAHAMRTINAESDGMEDLLAITETNNCFADGVQYVTGCTFGNNALIYRDIGKTAFTLSRRDGKGLRICSRPESQDIIKGAFSYWQMMYQQVVVEQQHDDMSVSKFKTASLERAFGTLELPFDELFTVREVAVEVPPYAAIHESVVCAVCGESVMKNHTTAVAGGKQACYTCAQTHYPYLDGNGIHCHGEV